jgi:hypothetical protein
MALAKHQLASGGGRACAPSAIVTRAGRPATVRVSAQAAAKIIDGKKIAEDIRGEIAAEVAALKQKTGKASPCCDDISIVLACNVLFTTGILQVPGLAVVLVGTRKDSETYVRSKKKSSVEVGFQSFGTELPETVSEEELLKVGEGRTGEGGGRHIVCHQVQLKVTRAPRCGHVRQQEDASHVGRASKSPPAGCPAFPGS